jgi:hypothetical protein
MQCLVKDQELEIQYEPGKGAFTYHISLPNTSHIKGRWGFLKVSGIIDDFSIQSKNLFTIAGSDKMMAINSQIRKALNKTGGDRVMVTLFLDQPQAKAGEQEVMTSFDDAGVLVQFQKLTKGEQREILADIFSSSDEEKQVKSILTWIDKLAVL